MESECLEVKEVSQRGVSALKNFVAGGFGGICLVFVGHPLDTIKVRMQTSSQNIRDNQRAYTNSLDCAKRLVINEGFRGFYKGMFAPIVGVAPIFALSFWGFAIGKKLQATVPSQTNFSLSQLCLAGMLSGVFSTILAAPGERIKCLLQIQQSQTHKVYFGPIDCAYKLYKSGGFKSLYRGTSATLIRDIPGSGAYFMFYEGVKSYLLLHREKKDLSNLETILAGGLAGIGNWIVAMPADVIKSRYQTNTSHESKKFHELFTSLVKSEGISALYKGIGPVILRAIPANAACFLGYEYAIKYLNYAFP